MTNFKYSGLLHIRAMDYETFTASNRGGTTFVYDIKKIKDAYYVFITSSVCSYKDNFSRKKGKLIATGRMDSLHEKARDYISGNVPSDDLLERHTTIFALEDVVGRRDLNDAIAAIKSSQDGVVYIKEVDFPFHSILTDRFLVNEFSFGHGVFEIFRSGNSFIYCKVEYEPNY